MRHTDKVFFAKHQKLIVKLFNTRLGRRFFHLEGSSVGNKKILAVMPNAIQWFEGYQLDEQGKWRIVKSTEFRTNNRFAYRMNTLLKWMPFLTWSENWYPQLAFGLTTTTVFPNADADGGKTSGDGSVARVDDVDGSDTWAGIRDGAGTGANDSAASGADSPRLIASSISNEWNAIGRAIFTFDATDIGDGDTISGATLSICVESLNNANFSQSIGVVVCAPASNTDFVASDFNIANWTMTLQSDTSIAVGSLATGLTNYNDFPFNATGLGNISKTVVSPFGIVMNADRTNTPPTWSSDGESRVDPYMADTAATTSDPKLVVTHSAPATGGVSTSLLLNVG